VYVSIANRLNFDAVGVLVASAHDLLGMLVCTQVAHISDDEGSGGEGDDSDSEFYLFTPSESPEAVHVHEPVESHESSDESAAGGPPAGEDGAGEEPAPEEGGEAPAPKAAAKAKAAGRRGRHGGPAYERYDIDAVGYILINEHPNSRSLDAHCTTCGCRVNRTYRERPGARERPRGRRHHQGRPMGTLLAWLRLPDGCPGEENAHRAALQGLTWQMRDNARQWGHLSGRFQPCFNQERAVFSDDEHDEPLRIA